MRAEEAGDGDACRRRRGGSRPRPAGPTSADSLSANSRAPMSTPLPGPSVTMRRTGRVGQASAAEPGPIAGTAMRERCGEQQGASDGEFA